MKRIRIAGLIMAIMVAIGVHAWVFWFGSKEHSVAAAALAVAEHEQKDQDHERYIALSADRILQEEKESEAIERYEWEAARVENRDCHARISADFSQLRGKARREKHYKDYYRIDAEWRAEEAIWKSSPSEYRKKHCPEFVTGDVTSP